MLCFGSLIGYNEGISSVIRRVIEFVGGVVRLSWSWNNLVYG